MLRSRILGGSAPRRRDDGRWARRDEQGAFLVVWALAAVSILVFAALAIDLGNIAQTKQHAQNSADSAAVSAVGDLASIPQGGSATTAEASAVTDAEAYVQKNDGSVTSADWTDLTKCPAGALPAGVTASSQTKCVGFFPNLSDPTGIAVAIPGRTVNYTFGKAGGLTRQGVSAVGEASVQNPGSGYVLPFGYSSAGGSGLQCLKTGSGNQAAVCTGFAVGSGQFGVLDSPRYRVCFNSCPASSNSAGNNTVVMGDINLGIDHGLRQYGGGQVICDSVPTSNGCNGYNNTLPYNQADYMVPLTGQTLNNPAPALFNADVNPFSIGSTGCTISTPRLFHPTGFQATDNCASDNPTAGASGPYLGSQDSLGSSHVNALNGAHITQFLVPTGASTDPTTNPAWSCYSGLTPPPDPRSDPIDKPANGPNIWLPGDPCLSAAISARAASPACSPPATQACPLFTAAIVKSPRFGIVPVVQSSNGSNPQQITGFLGVYLDLAFGKKLDKSNGSVDSLLAWVFPLDLIQSFNVGNGPGLGSFNGGPFVANLCSLVAGNC
jgi:Flp pilus assembly protein TadG